MSSYDQKKQKINRDQYNANKMHIHIQSESQADNTSQGVTKNVPTDINYNYHLDLVKGSVATVDFTLSRRHTIKYLREAQQEGYDLIRLYVDGKEVFRQGIRLFQIKTFNQSFQIEGVHCLFTCRMLLVGLSVKCEVGGYEVIKI